MNNNDQNKFSQTDDFEIIDLPMDQGVQQNIDSNGQGEGIPSFDSGNQQNIPPSYTEMPIGDSPFPSQDMNNATLENSFPTSQVEMNPTNQESQSEVYIPKKDVSTDEKPIKEKLDKSTKEMIIMGVLVAITIILLPVLYNLTMGKYHVMDKIKGLFNKNETQQTENTDTTEETEPVKVDVEESEDAQETDSLTFDFSNYNNQVVNTEAIKNLLIEYQNNVTSLDSVIQNGFQLITITIATDMENAQSTITDSETTIQNFSTEYLSQEFNYLTTVVDNNDGTFTIQAKQQ